MSKQIKARSIRHPEASIGTREVALASLGALSLLRKQAIKSIADVVSIGERLPEASAILIEGIGERAQALLDDAVATSTLLRKRAGELLRIAAVEVEQRIAPLLATVGKSPKSAKRKPVNAKRKAKPATRKSVVKRARRKAA